ncbi:MAG: dienelactone hydrolase family protein [Chelatococcus sp.]|uniref:alpha/beta hydrolase n=1 Tax=unclassified Chelatococcus TaxID=2638111 RepID=UPI001BCDC49F|nr:MULTISPECIES: dienelactone hydrolase family protein [unclassified Chelatococcus]MBS7741677.1 dienelactone hydrolase family protein [Chelatococcus sp. HY11]MBX3536234.1 dienelactone hydrolase family protein [Chelatococcus sp.]MBX3544304.1 dienelactone hydrolase family protein [Chelatococcus sp.]MCO5079172.1 dienelactone hydrolase family protein [Chelatococcus sp.]
MAQDLNGPRLPAKSGTAKQLVVFLHGYGADGNDLIEIGRQWQPWLPDAAFVSPHAPEPCVGAPMGRQWFPLTRMDPNERWNGVRHAEPTLNDFLDAELSRQGVSPDKLALVGFSQGTMMALHVGLRRKVAPAAVLGFSGLFVTSASSAPEPAADGPLGRPPVFLLHGDSDEVIPAQALFMSAEELAKADVPCQWHLAAGLGHGIDNEGLRQGGLFLAQSFGLPYPAA